MGIFDSVFDKLESGGANFVEAAINKEISNINKPEAPLPPPLPPSAAKKLNPVFIGVGVVVLIGVILLIRKSGKK